MGKICAPNCANVFLGKFLLLIYQRSILLVEQEQDKTF